MSDKVLLTGISGWFAKHTAIELLNLDFKVLGTVRNKSLIDETEKNIKFPDRSYLAFGYSTNFVEDDIRVEYSSLSRPKIIFHYNFLSTIIIFLFYFIYT